MSRLFIRRSGPLTGRASLPGDLHIGQQALLWAALADGESTLEGLAPRRDHRLLAAALRELGVVIEEHGASYRVRGVGLSGLKMPTGALHAGASESTLEILVALLVGQYFGTRVEATGSALTHSLRTLIGPLRERGGHVQGRRSDDGDQHAPVAVAPLLEGELLDSVEIGIPFGDPSTKLGLLLSGLYARGVTAISESMLSRDHAERALLALGAPLETAAGMTLLDTSHCSLAPGGTARFDSSLAPGGTARFDGAGADRPRALPRDALGWPGFVWRIPGDFTLATFVLAAALSIEGSDVRLENVGLNPTRTAFLEALSGTHARVEVTPRGDCAGNEPLGELRARFSSLSSIRVGGERAFRLLDEVPALLALALSCRTRSTVRDIGLLRGRSPDALKATVELLARFGVGCTVYEDGVEIDPPAGLRAAHVSAEVPPPQALLGVLLGLRAEGETQIDDAERLDACYPGVVSTLQTLGASIERREAP